MSARSAARVTTKRQLETLVGRLNDYARLRPLREAEAAGAMGGGVAPGAAVGAGSANAGTPATTPQVQTAPSRGAGTDGQQQEQNVDDAGVPTVKDVVEQLNAIRGGRSLKEQDVKDQLDRYFEGLEDGEKEALHAYLKGIAQIVSGQVDAGSAEEPKNHGVETQTSGQKSKTVKPNIVRRPAAAAQPSAVAASGQLVTKPPRENTAAPAPIVPKKR